MNGPDDYDVEYDPQFASDEGLRAAAAALRREANDLAAVIRAGDSDDVQADMARHLDLERHFNVLDAAIIDRERAAGPQNEPMPYFNAKPARQPDARNYVRDRY